MTSSRMFLAYFFVLSCCVSWLPTGIGMWWRGNKNDNSPQPKFDPSIPRCRSTVAKSGNIPCVCNEAMEDDTCKRSQLCVEMDLGYKNNEDHCIECGKEIGDPTVKGVVWRGKNCPPGTKQTSLDTTTVNHQGSTSENAEHSKSPTTSQAVQKEPEAKNQGDPSEKYKIGKTYNDRYTCNPGWKEVCKSNQICIEKDLGYGKGRNENHCETCTDKKQPEEYPNYVKTIWIGEKCKDIIDGNSVDPRTRDPNNCRGAPTDKEFCTCGNSDFNEICGPSKMCDEMDMGYGPGRNEDKCNECKVKKPNAYEKTVWVGKACMHTLGWGNKGKVVPNESKDSVDHVQEFESTESPKSTAPEESQRKEQGTATHRSTTVEKQESMSANKETNQKQSTESPMSTAPEESQRNDQGTATHRSTTVEKQESMSANKETNQKQSTEQRMSEMAEHEENKMSPVKWVK